MENEKFKKVEEVVADLIDRGYHVTYHANTNQICLMGKIVHGKPKYYKVTNETGAKKIQIELGLLNYRVKYEQYGDGFYDFFITGYILNLKDYQNILDLVDHAISSFSFLIKPNEKLGHIDFAARICEHYSLEDPRTLAVVVALRNCTLPLLWRQEQNRK